jgi:hypothetical protein
MSCQKHTVKANFFYFSGIFLIASSFGITVFLIASSFIEIHLDPWQWIALPLGGFGLFFGGTAMVIHGGVLREEN